MAQDDVLNEDNSSLEQLRSRLYSTKAPQAFSEPTLQVHNSTRESQIPHTEPSTWAPPLPPPPKKPISWTLIFLGFAVAFFVVAGGIAAYFFWGGVRTVTNDNVIITIQGPTSIASGSSIPLVVTIQNKNPAAITDADIAIDFPEGTRSPENVTQPLTRYTNTIGTVPAGGTITRTVQAVLFGSVNQTVNVPITFHYHTANSNAVYEKSQSFGYTITSSPITIDAQATDSVASGQPFDVVLTIRSNATTPLTNVAVNAQYPFGFAVQNISSNSTQKTGTVKKLSTIAPSTTFFALGTLAPGEERTITITGTLTGVEKDQRDFQFTAGTQNTDGTASLGLAYASQSSSILIAKPFLAVSLSLNHESTEPTVVSSGKTVSSLVSWVNTLSASISDPQITVSLTGNALDPRTVNAYSGYYDSSKNSILFSSQTANTSNVLNPGDTGSGNFTFSTKSGAALAALRNPTIQLAVSIAGLPTGGSAESITSTLVHTVKVSTDLQLASRILYSAGPFKNTGPWPPVPNTATTYTVQLAVTNTVNSVGGATATMILPPYVTFTGATSPSDGTITYDSSSRTVTWKVGDVPAGALAHPASAAFQISFTPSVSQSQSSPILVGNQTLTGTDRFTTTQVGNTAPALTTQAATDPAYKQSFGTVGN